MIRTTCIVGLLWSFVVLGQAPSNWTVELSTQVKTVPAVVPSPDGTWVAWVETHPVIEAARSESESHLWVAKADGSSRMEFTRGPKSATSPAWSADGKWVYFLSDRFGKYDVFRIPLAGGEAEQLTKVKGAVKAFAVSRDGSQIAYLSHEPDPDDEKAVTEKRDFHVADEKPKNARIYVTPARRVTGEFQPKAITPGDRHVMEIEWSPDGEQVAFTYWATPEVNNWRKGRLAESEVSTGTVREIALVGLYAGSPRYAASGRWIAFPQFAGEKVTNPGASRVALYDRSSGKVRQLAATPNESPRMVDWLPGDRSLLVLDQHGTREVLYEVPVDGPVKEVYAPAAGLLGAARLSANGSLLALPFESSEQAPEAFAFSLADKRLVQVSAANADLPKAPIGRTEVMTWTAKDGQRIEGLLTYPASYQAGQKVPLLLNIHGGPAGGFTEQYTGRLALYPIAVFAAKGYAVLRPNPRGSTGYGREFRYANFADWGGKDFDDDQAGVDMLIQKGIVDPNRMAVMGWSYGGYMTGWTIGHTQRFKAAAIGAGVMNLVSFTGTTDIGDFLPDYFGGEFWQKADLYRERSPITYAGKVTTPTLVLHGEADERVPPSQGLEMYTALKRHNVPTKMVTYPRTPHSPSEPKFLRDIAQRHLDWAEQYLH